MRARTRTGKLRPAGLPVAVDAVQAEDVVSSASIDENLDLLLKGSRGRRPLIEGYLRRYRIRPFGLDPEPCVP
ncbi:hypothetical protein ACIBPB_32690, partial [Micromonospora sp. NPDC049836]|uniref:hypothetical protein n=1 Tax=Micromonospora sp. NPDC049836 TaxID=3364274 RepID=UPI0037AFEF88